MKKYALLFIVVILLAQQSFAQPDNLYSFYQYNTNIVNPAYAGSHESLDVGVTYTWGNVHLFDFESHDGAPRYFLINAHSPIGENFGIGVSYETMKLGPIEEKDTNLFLSYKISLANSSILSFGMNAGFSNLNFDLVNTNPINEDDPLFYQDVDEKIKNFGTGIYYHTDRFYSGLAYSYYYGNGVFINNVGEIRESSANFSILNGFAGYVLNLSDKVKLKPSIMMFYNSINEEAWFYLTGNIYFLDSIELGLHYNLSKAVAFSINSPTIAKTFKLGLSIDLLGKNDFVDTSYQNFMLFTNFNIDAFGKGHKKTYF